MHLIAELEADASEVPRARHLLEEALRSWSSDEDAVDTALLLASELVTNAVRHGRPPVHVHAQMSQDGVVRVEVDDASGAPVRPQDPDVEDVGGRGLQLVEMLSSAWGSRLADTRHDDGRTGKCVWFELRSPGAA
ncbi:ATP-binding protein [Pseudokineococcus basanitobsidens]|uniref:ATP-binding protein n=1 Tax=Pseudokineococcus basanitobsidens TaxID=1926649 RepID=A0ABU8RIM7_9ACTN